MRLKRDQKGQVVVETALIMPVMVFIILGMLQLLMMQHARVMTEFAGYQAARAGTVWSGDVDIMSNAALLTLLPTMERANDWRIILNWAKNKLKMSVTNFVQKGISTLTGYANEILGPLGVPIAGVPDIRFLGIDVISPAYSAAGKWINDFGSNKEVDFDSVAPSDRENTLLQIQMRYLYQLRVPFVNQLIFNAWMASKARVLLTGVQVQKNKATGVQGKALEKEIESKLPGQNWTEYWVGNKEANFLRLLYNFSNKTHVYFLPMTTTHIMRMQSSPYKDEVKMTY